MAKLSPLGRVEVDVTKCTGCGLCARECPSGALVASNDADVFRLVFHYGECLTCGACTRICPEKALRVERRLETAGLGSQAVLFEDELVKCSECGAPVGPKSMVEKMRSKVKAVRSELCIACKSRRPGTAW